MQRGKGPRVLREQIVAGCRETHHPLPDNNGFSFGRYFVPSSYKPHADIPLVLLFHRAIQKLNALVTPMSALAEEKGFARMAIDQRRSRLWLAGC